MLFEFHDSQIHFHFVHNMNNFSNANEVFKILNKHQCEYFVLYQDEDKKLQYKSSKQLKVKIDNHRYIISL